MTTCPNGEYTAPKRIELHWVDENGESLGTSIPDYIEARAAWVGLYGDRWIEIFPGGVDYAKPN